MSKKNLIITKLEGYSGIRLKDGEPLHFKPGINLLVGRNGSGKTNLLQLVNSLSQKEIDIKSKIESSFFRKKAKNILKKESTNIRERWGEMELVNYSFNDDNGYISIALKDTTDDRVLENIIQPGEQSLGQIHNIKQGPTFKIKPIHSSHRTLELNFGGSFNTHVLSTNRDRDISSMIEEPIGMVNEFVYNRFLDFFNSEEFENKIQELELLINEKLRSFFGITNKKIRLHKSTRNYLHIKPILFDGDNEIKPENISLGEGALLNIVFELSSSDIDQYDVLSFDEPEIHMHDDMVSVFVQEIIRLSNGHPSTRILIATHSTSLIEKLAYYGDEKINLIVFNDKREVSNSNKDIDLINALNRNGVWFSPLMLSKRFNLYIENQGKGETSHKDFYGKFFDPNNKPNIIPIGSGASVEQSQSFSDTLQELLKSSDINSKGIRDGDVWVKDKLIQYLSGRIELNEFISPLTGSQGLYIRIDKKKRGANPDFYFNFWEIENLYLMEEILHCWKLKRKVLSTSILHKLLKKNISILSKEFLEVFYKALYPRPNKKHDLQKKVSVINDKLVIAKEVAERESELNDRAILLVNRLIEIDEVKWLPGKEIYRLLEKSGYSFDDTEVDYDQLAISIKVREILDF